MPLTETETKAKGIVTEGYGAASGRARFVEIGGSIRAQKPHFRAHGFPIDHVFNGTINVDIKPRHFETVRPAATLTEIKWHDTLPPETFSFYDLVLTHQGRNYAALLYFPHPETKTGFAEAFPGFSTLELLCEHVEGLAYGDEVLIEAASGSIKFCG